MIKKEKKNKAIKKKVSRKYDPAFTRRVKLNGD